MFSGNTNSDKSDASINNSTNIQAQNSKDENLKEISISDPTDVNKPKIKIDVTALNNPNRRVGIVAMEADAQDDGLTDSKQEIIVNINDYCLPIPKVGRWGFGYAYEVLDLENSDSFSILEKLYLAEAAFNNRVNSARACGDMAWSIGMLIVAILIQAQSYIVKTQNADNSRVQLFNIDAIFIIACIPVIAHLIQEAAALVQNNAKRYIQEINAKRKTYKTKYADKLDDTEFVMFTKTSCWGLFSKRVVLNTHAMNKKDIFFELDFEKAKLRWLTDNYENIAKSFPRLNTASCAILLLIREALTQYNRRNNDEISHIANIFDVLVVLVGIIADFNTRSALYVTKNSEIEVKDIDSIENKLAPQSPKGL